MQKKKKKSDFFFASFDVTHMDRNITDLILTQICKYELTKKVFTLFLNNVLNKNINRD